MSQRTLEQRGIAFAAEQALWQPQTLRQSKGWVYPVYHYQTGAVIAQRWKAAEPQAMKYAWLPSKPSDAAADWYILPKTRQAIAAAKGTAWLANGEPALLAYHEAGIHNAIATTLSEISVPTNLREVLKALGISRLLYPVDKDEAGEKSAVKWRDALRGTSIDYQAFSWGESAPAKADANDIWVALGFNRQAFAQTLQNLQPLELSLPAPLPKQQSVTQADCTTPQAVIDSIASRLNIQQWKANGWSAKNISSPFREDSHPSAAFNRNSGVLHDFGTGESYSPKELAEFLGIQYQSVTQVTVARPKASVDSVTQVTVANFKASEIVDLQYISELDLGKLGATNAIRSPLATGKTALIAKIIKAAPSHARVLIITHLQALAENISERLSAELPNPIECYRHIPLEYRPSAYRLVCSYDSLHTIADEWDYVFIDEHEQFHRHLGSGTMKGGEPLRAYSKLLHILQNAAQVTVLDAHMSKASQDWLSKLRGSVTSIENRYRQNWGNLSIEKYESAVLMNAFAAAEGQSKGVVIPTNSRSKSRDYYDLAVERFGKEAVVLINGENSSSSEARDFVRDLTDEKNRGKALSSIFPKLRVLIASPSLATGIDVQAEVAGVFGVFTAQNWVNAFNILQMMMRYRRAESRQMVLLGQGSAKVAEDYLSRAQGTAAAAEFNRYGVEAAPELQAAILDLQSAFAHETSLHQSDLFAYLEAAAVDEGFKLSYSETYHEQLAEKLKNTRKERAEREKAATLIAQALSPLEFEILQQNSELSAEKLEAARFGLLRWKVEFAAGQAITADLYDRLHTNGRRADFNRFVDLLDKAESLKKRDRYEAQEGVLLMKRQHFIRNRDLVTMAGQAVFGANWLHSEEELNAGMIAERLDTFLRLHYQEIQQYIDRRLDLSHDPLAIFRRLLKRVGLGLSRRQIMVNGERYYLYGIDAAERAILLAYGAVSLAARQSRELLQTRNDSLDKRERSNGQEKSQKSLDYDEWLAQSRSIPI
jgi:hypothetical protein